MPKLLARALLLGLVLGLLLSGLLGALLAPAPAAAQGDAWPTKPIKLIVPFPPGGSLDTIARRVQPGVQKELGVSLIIENKGGASGSIGTAVAAQAAPDGYTILMVFDTHVVNPSLIPNLPFDTLKDFTPIMQIGWAPMLLAVHPSTPYANFADVVAAAKVKPESVTYGTVGQGSLAHLAMTQIAGELKIKWTHVPYKGGAPLTNDAIAGHLPIAISSVASVGPHVKSGKLRPLAVTSPERHAAFPDVPTIAELGVPGFAANAWWGLVAPTRTPDAVIQRLNKAFRAALEEPAVKRTLIEGSGVIYVLSSSAEFGAFLDREVPRWAKVVKDNNIAPE